MMNFSQITNNIAVLYSLAFIIVLLMYIAFYKKSPRQKSGRK